MSDYTAWPTITDVANIALSIGTGVTLSQATAVQSQVLNSVIESVNRKTNRTFIPYSETRYYNGNDSGQIEIDEFITISTAEIIGWFGITSGMTLANLVTVTRVGFPQTVVQIYRGSLPALYMTWLDRFPAGRNNIAITALWGYATTIPADLWLGVAYQAAGQLINWKQYDPDGYLIKFTEADVSETRKYMDPFKFFGTEFSWKSLIKRYKKSDGYYFRKQQRALV